MKLALITLTMVTAMTTMMTLSTMTNCSAGCPSAEDDAARRSWAQLPRITHLAMSASMTKVMAMAVMVMATVMTASMTTVIAMAAMMYFGPLPLSSRGGVLADTLRRRPG